MSSCQHCGQGAIAKDRNGPVCPDCWDEGYYESADQSEKMNQRGHPMTEQAEDRDALLAEAKKLIAGSDKELAEIVEQALKQGTG